MATSEIEKFGTLIVGEIQELRSEMNERFDQVDTRFDKVESRLDRIEVRLDHIEAELVSITKRLDTLEAQGASNAGFAKEIDDLRTRVHVLEQTLAAKS